MKTKIKAAAVLFAMLGIFAFTIPSQALVVKCVEDDPRNEPAIAPECPGFEQTACCDLNGTIILKQIGL